MSTDAELSKGAVAALSDTDERARRAVKLFRSMLPGLSAYARAITGDKKLSVKMVMNGTSSAYTDGKSVYIIPPIQLGDNVEHVRSLCDKRSDTGRQKCAACANNEYVMTLIYHELAHICFDSFQPVTDRDKVDMTRRAVEEVGTKFAKQLMEKYEAAPSYVQRSYQAVSGLFSEFLPLILNGLEDARVNTRMFEARAGIRPMFEEASRQIFTEGVRQPGTNETKMWRDYPPNLQAIIGCYLKALGYEYSGWLHPKVEADLNDPTLDALTDQAAHAKSASDIYNLSFKVLAQLRVLGYCKSDKDPEDEEESSGEEQPDQDPEETPGDGDDPDAAGGDGSPDEQDGAGDAEAPERDDAGSDGGAEADESGGPADGADDAASDGSEGGDDAPGEAAEQPDGEGDAGDGTDAGDGDGSAEGPEDAQADAPPGEGGAEGGDGPPGDGGEPDGDGPESDVHDGSGGAGPDASDAGEADGSDGEVDRGDDEGAGGRGAAAPDGNASGDEAEPDPEGEGGAGSASGALAPEQHDEEVGAGEDDSRDDEGAREGSPDQPDREGDVDPTAGGAGGGQAVAPGEQGDRPDEGLPDRRDGVDGDGDSSESELADGPRDGEGSEQPDAGRPDSDQRPDPDVDAPEGLTDGEAPDESAGPSDHDTDHSGGEGQPDDDGDGGHEGGEGGGAGETASLPEQRPDPSAGEAGEGGDGGGESDDFGGEDDEGGPLPDDEILDTGAATEGIEVEFDEGIDYGTPDDISPDLERLLGHDHGPHTPGEARAEQAEVEAVTKAIMQGEYFETPSAVVHGVRHYRYGDPDKVNGRTMHAWTVKRRYNRSEWKEFGLDGDIEPPQSILGPALLRMRRAFGDNERRADTVHLKGGRVNSRVLGKRAAVGDPRLFKKRSHPGKRDYVVYIGMDISASNAGLSLLLLKRAVVAQAELLHRMGIKFAIVAHSGHFHKEVGDIWESGFDLEIYHVKDVDEPWNDSIKERLREMAWDSGNLDGHALEYLRKQIDREIATDKVILYYSDGKMPAANHDEELEILQREIRVCSQKGIHLLGVGIRTDSPREHGLDTVQVDDYADIGRVVEHLERRLLAV